MEFVIAARLRRIRRKNGAVQRRMTTALNRSLRDNTSPFSNPNFRAVYRLTPDMALGLIEELRPHYKINKNSSAIPIEIKFLSALHFYAQGSYQKVDGKDGSVNISQPSVSRAIAETTAAFNSLPILRKWIKFPSSNEISQIIEKNHNHFNMPGVLGYVDGTHILLIKPTQHEELYINRKGQHSLNVQMICDSELIILNVVARYPGSTHDSFVWRSSAARDKMMQIEPSCWLLGDSGYPLEPWLLTPILNAPEDSPEALYTQCHIRGRNCIERCFGVLKARFRCIHKHRVLEYAPTKVGHIINACAILHNICVKARLEER